MLHRLNSLSSCDIGVSGDNPLQVFRREIHFCKQPPVYTEEIVECKDRLYGDTVLEGEDRLS